MSVIVKAELYILSILVVQNFKTLSSLNTTQNSFILGRAKQEMRSTRFDKDRQNESINRICNFLDIDKH